MTSARKTQPHSVAGGSAPPTAAAAVAGAAAGASGVADEAELLPVLDSVTDYEKIKRIGEGTFGIVCECC